MSAAKKDPPESMLFSTSGLVFIVISLIVYRVYEKAHLNEHYLGQITIIGVFLCFIFLILLGTTLWNRYCETVDERNAFSIEEKGAVRIGKDEKGSEVFLKESYRSMHTQVIGTTNAGKTESVILPMIITDIENGNGCLIIDGKSDSGFLDKLHAYVTKHNRLKDFYLFSLCSPESSQPFNPLSNGSAIEVCERVFSSFPFENEYYRSIQFKIFYAILRLIDHLGRPRTFKEVHRLLSDRAALRDEVDQATDSRLRREISQMLELNPQEYAQRTSGLEASLSHFCALEVDDLYNSPNPEIDFTEALSSNKICYFQIPTMAYPFLGEATGKLVLQTFQSAVSRRQSQGDGDKKFFSCYLDDFQDYIYEKFGALLNKSRSANVGIVFSHQSLGDLEKVSEAFKNVVLTNTNIKVIMRTNHPETAEYFAKSFGTKTTEKFTERKTKSAFGARETGEISARDVEAYIVHPNQIRSLGLGQGFVTIPLPTGTKVIRVDFEKRPDLPALQFRLSPFSHSSKKRILSNQKLDANEQSVRVI